MAHQRHRRLVPLTDASTTASLCGMGREELIAALNFIERRPIKLRDPAHRKAEIAEPLIGTA